MDPLFDPADFRIPPGVVHVCAAGETGAQDKPERKDKTKAGK